MIEDIVIFDRIDEKELRRIILTSDCCISDLDDTDFKSPAKRIAFSYLFSLGAFDPKFITWCLGTGYELLKRGKDAESERFRLFTEFLKGKENKFVDKFDIRKIESLIFDGVKEVYNAIPKAYKVYITRNIAEIAQVFADYLGFNEVLAKKFDKGKTVDEFICSHNFINYFLKGDSKEDEQALDVLEFYKRKGKVNNIISCYLSNSMNDFNSKFTINVIGGYSGLVSLLQSI